MSKKQIKVEMDALGAIESAGSEIAELGEEMRNWFDNMPESFQGAEKGEAVEQAASALEDAGIGDHVDELRAAISAAAQGEPAKRGCPEHVVGQQCPVCKWSGKVHAQPKPELTVYDTPKIVFGESYIASLTVGTWTSYTPDADGIAAAERAYEDEMVKYRRATGAPARRDPVPAVEPIEGFAERVEAMRVFWTERRPAGKRSPSRADRLDNARSALSVGIDALKTVVDDTGMADDDRMTAVTDKLQELEDALSELESVEFPGMFG